MNTAYMQNQYQQYQNNSIMTAPPEELTLMLYNGCIKFISKAISCCQKQDIQETNQALLKAQAIITELDSTLNDSFTISKNLHQLYGFINRHLLQSNIHKDITLMEESLGLVTELRDTWKEAVLLSRKQR